MKNIFPQMGFEPDTSQLKSLLLLQHYIVGK